MGRLGYAMVALLMVLLAAYVFWPSGYEVGDSWLGAGRPQQFIFERDGEIHEVSPAVVIVSCQGERYERSPNSDAAFQLLRRLELLRPAPSRVREGVRPEDVTAYGFSPSSARLRAEGLDLRWTVQSNVGWLYDAKHQRLAQVESARIEQLDQYRRFDRTQLMDAGRVVAIGVGNLQLRKLPDGSWQDVAAPERPALSGRVSDLITLLDTLELQQFHAQGTLPATAQTLTLGFADHTQRTLAFADGVLAYQGLPTQVINRVLEDALGEALAELSRDRLFALRDTLLGNPIRRAKVTHNDTWVLTVERMAEDDELDGQSAWDVSWPAGRLRAHLGSAYKLAEALNAIEISQPQLRVQGQGQGLSDSARGPGWTRLQLERGELPDLDVAWHADGRILTDQHQARVVSLPPLLQQLSPEQFIDVQIFQVPSERLAKLQRIRPGHGGEVFARADDGRWARSYPQPGLVEPAALAQVLNQLGHLRATAVFLPNAAQRSAWETNDQTWRLDVRLLPVAGGRGLDQELRLDDAVERDWGIGLRQESDGTYVGYDADEGVGYRFDEDTVRTLFAPLDLRVFLPVPMVAIQAVVLGVAQDVRIERQGQNWSWRLGQDQQRADAIAVRRFLQELSHAEYQSQDAQPLALDPQRVLARVTLEVPGLSADADALVLQLAPSSEGLRLEVSVRHWNTAAEILGTYAVNAEVQNLLQIRPETLRAVEP